MKSVRDLIIQGYNGGDWAGNGITSADAAANPSARAIGYALGSEAASGGTFLGQPADASTILARYTLPGDATLDGIVDFNDLALLAQNYNTTVSDTTESWWYHGDFTYDGIVDFNDLAKMAQHYNTGLPAPSALPSAPPEFAAALDQAFSSVPEPGSSALVALASLALASHRRRRR
jgi:hypothetical protein